MVRFVVDIIFFSGKRKAPPCLSNGRYRPHFEAKCGGEYLGVCFEGGEAVSFDNTIKACALPAYPDTMDYSALTVGAEFFIFEGGQIVGEGKVAEIFEHQKYVYPKRKR